MPGPTAPPSGGPGETPAALSTSARRVQDALDAFGLDLRVVELPASTRTAEEAARAVGCEVGRIAKSLVFRAARGNGAVLVIASGRNRVDLGRVAALVGEPLEKADAGFVRERTGFAIGGVPPVGHLEPLPTFIDEDLLAYPSVWAAAGTPRRVFELTPRALREITGGRVTAVAARP